MAREVQQARGHFHRSRDHGIGGVQSGLFDVAGADLAPPTAPVAGGQAGGDVLGQAQDLADLANGAARTEVDDGGGDARSVAAIAIVDVLDDLLAPFMLEVHVDVGRLVPVLGQEALEQQVGFRRVHGGDAKHVTNGGIGRRSPALAQDALVARHSHDVVDGQEVGRDRLAADEGQFLVQQGLNLGGNAVRVVHGGVATGQFPQPLLRVPAGRDRLLRVLVAQIGQVERRARQEGGRLGHGLGRVPEQASHFGGRLQPAFAVDFQATTGGLDGRTLADAGQDVLQVAVFGRGVEDVVDGQQRDVRLRRQGLQPRQAAPVVATPGHGGAQPDGAGRGFDHAGQDGVQPLQPFRRHDDQQQVFRVGQQVAQADLAFPLPRPPVAQGQQARQPAPARARFRVGDDVGGPVVEGQPRARQQAEVRRPAFHRVRQGGIVQRVVDEGDLAGAAALAHLFRRSQALGAQGLQGAPGPHHARHGVAVRQPQARMAAQDRRQHQVLGVGSAAQEGEVAGRRQFRIVAARIQGAHANRPWMNQRGSSVSP
ncbi:hypothetical protein D3C77_198190 [compost metagenome]